jgi:MFS transporter, DHA2 family, metal-tetracycline-proton antiporter
MTDRDRAGGRTAGASGILAIVCVATLAGVLNASAVGVVLPEIAGDMAADAGQLGWLMTGFLLVYGIAIPFYGRLADRQGARRWFLIGLGVFSAGSLLSAVAPNYGFLLAARVVQAVGGAAVPGLGMTLAIRAFGPEKRGTVLGVIAATIGAGSAMGPLLGGALSEAMGWRSIFVVTALAATVIPLGLRLFPKDEERSGGRLDVVGGVGLGLLVVGALLATSEGARAGWGSAPAVAGVIGAVAGLAVLVMRQRTAREPFIQRELLGNGRYVALAGMSFAVMAANLPPLIGLPIMLAAVHGLAPLEIGLVLLPGAALSSVLGVVAGRLTDRRGARLPAWVGGPLMLVAMLGLSTYAGKSVVAMAAFSGLMGASFGLVNTPLATAISRSVRGEVLASALSVNSMLFFLGGSFGTAALMVVMASPGAGAESWNPLHEGAAAGLSDGFLLLVIPVLAAIGLSLVLPGAEQPEAASAPKAETDGRQNWVENCAVPWSPRAEVVSADDRSRRAATERSGRL